MISAAPCSLPTQSRRSFWQPRLDSAMAGIMLVPQLVPQCTVCAH